MRSNKLTVVFVILVKFVIFSNSDGLRVACLWLYLIGLAGALQQLRHEVGQLLPRDLRPGYHHYHGAFTIWLRTYKV